MEIVVPAGAITVATVVLGFILNQALKYFGLELSLFWKKAIVFLVALALTGYFGVQSGLPLPDPSADLVAFVGALLAYAGAIFKAAQSVYDAIGKGIFEA